LNTKQKDGWSALHFAAKNGWEETVAALVELGISPNVKNDVDMTPLHYAAWDATVETCQKLIDLGLVFLLLRCLSCLVGACSQHS